MKWKFGIWIYSLILISLTGTLIDSCKEDEDNTPEPPLTIKDIDGNVYHTVTIGKQVWMVENLKTTRFRNGDSIPNVIDGNAWFNLSSGAYCFYNNDIVNKDTFGCLYNWYAIHDSRNIAPSGWHVPTEEDWGSLIAYVGGLHVAGGILKETGTIHWSSPNTGASNNVGFNGLPAGIRLLNGDFGGIGLASDFWSITELTSDIARNIHLDYYWSGIGWEGDDFNNGYSIRCLKD